MSGGFAAAEADRRIENALSTGVVTEIDAARVRARVRVGELQTPFIPVMQARVGQLRMYAMPSVGEQVAVAAPGGDYARAFVMGSITASNAPGAEAEHVFLDLGGGELRITGDLWVDGTIRVTEDVLGGAAEISLVTHTHAHGDPAGETAAPS